LQVFIWYFTRIQLIKILVVSKSTKICIETDLVVLVVFKEIERYRKILQTSRTLIVEYVKSLFFNLGDLLRAMELQINKQVYWEDHYHCQCISYLLEFLLKLSSSAGSSYYVTSKLFNMFKSFINFSNSLAVNYWTFILTKYLQTT